jgi:hypothetical protein
LTQVNASSSMTSDRLFTALSWSDAMVDISSDANWVHIRTWRMKAEEMRTAADGLKNESARQGLWAAAANYDRLADEAEERDQPEASRFRPRTG